MKNRGIKFVVLLIFGFGHTHLYAQAFSASSNMVAQPIPDRTVVFDISLEGESKPIIWGLDLAWLSEENIIRGINFMGKINIGVIRSSFMPTNPLVGDSALQGIALTNTNLRINIIKNNIGAGAEVVLNCDHPSVDSYFAGNPVNWAKLIDETTRMHEEQGFKVVTVSPFNEPDYSATGQGTIEDFYGICGELKKNSRFDGIRISGGNTLNNDEALNWYNYLKDRLDEGNTHQLAGNFNNYANFFETVRFNEDHATNDELHNVMEAIVGVEYGLQTGIWWGTAEYARGEFCKASNGERLGYAEHRSNWTAAAVYRTPDGNIQAFGGTSERQAVTTTYRYFSKDRDVYFDGYGPQREYTLDLPGGTGYQNGQTNAERVVNISWGDDIQPVIDGKYILVNRGSGKVMEVDGGSTIAGANIQQGTNTGATYQQWNVTPVASRIGGDFSYFTFTAVHSGKAPDVQNFSLNNGGNIIAWDDVKNANQQWYLEYAADGWFFIRSRHSSLCIDVANASTANGANVQQFEKRGGVSQQWRFLPVGAKVEFDAPSAPGNLLAKANEESIQLDWSASPETDVVSYTIFRAETTGGPYNTIARNVTGTFFLDNSATINKPYYYVIKAVDNALNNSAYSLEVSTASTDSNSLLAYYPFEDNLNDSSINLNHGASQGSISFVEGKEANQALVLNGTDAFLQLPTNIANQEEITISTWVYWVGGLSWQRIFDFGNGESEYMFLTTSTGLVGGKLRFAIKNGGVEQTLNAPLLPFNEWVHVAVTLKEGEARLYVNGELADESNAFTILPIDFMPALNYIGRSQFATLPLFKGRIDNFVMYNFTLSTDQIAEVYTLGLLNLTAPTSPNTDNISELINPLSVWPLPAKDKLFVNYTTENNSIAKLSIFDMRGKLLMNKHMKSGNLTEIDVSNLPAGLYVLRIKNNGEAITKKLIVE